MFGGKRVKQRSVGDALLTDFAFDTKAVKFLTLTDIVLLKNELHSAVESAAELGNNISNKLV